MLEPERLMAHHAVARVSWLRSAALRANGGIVALAALLIGVATTAADEGAVLLAGLAGLVAGALAIAMGEYAVAASRAEAMGSGPAQAAPDADDPVAYHRTGHPHDLAPSPAGGLGDYHGASPLQVAITSAATFGLGASLPLSAASAFKLAAMPLGIGLVSLAGVALLAGIGARAVGLVPAHCIVRATGWAAVGLAGAYAIGRLIGPALV